MIDIPMEDVKSSSAVVATFDAAQFLKDLTTRAGVYRMLDKHDTVMYVGKAKNLKNGCQATLEKQG